MSIRDHLNSGEFIAQVSRVLPKHCSPERMARVALTALTRTPDLAKCDQASFFRCMMDLSQWGLEPDGRHAHLIPFRNNKRGITECQLIVDYKGLIALAYRSGSVKSIHADVIYEGDIFKFSLGQVESHEPWAWRQDLDRPDKRGELRGAYCIVSMKDDVTKCEVMSIDDIKAIRGRSRAGSSGPWKTDFNEMAKKTVFRRCTKWLPLSAEIMDAFDRDFDKFPAIEGTVRDTPVPAGLDALKERLSLPQSDDDPMGEGLEDEGKGAPVNSEEPKSGLFDKGNPNAQEA